MAAANRHWLNAWDDLRQELQECRELDDERVLCLHRFVASGKGSGMNMELMRPEGAALFHIRGGKVMRLVHYFDRSRALADLGLAPGRSSSPQS
jgi:hypothetical protein